MIINFQESNMCVCPVCYSGSSELLWSVSAEDAAQHFIIKENNWEGYQKLVAHLRLLWEKDKCDVMKCNACAFCFSYPYVAGDAAFYNLAFDRTGYPAWKWEYQKTYDVLSKIKSSDIKLLEVGAGNGSFLKKVISGGVLKENIVATEFSEYGRNEIHDLHVRSYACDIRVLLDSSYQNFFDVVCLFQVLEHMDNLDRLFERLHFGMKKGGSLFLAVPNAERIVFNELNGALLEMPPNHIGRWNKNCFVIKGQQFGFSVHEYAVEVDSYISIVRKFVTYRFLRNAQMNGTIENRIIKMKNKKAGKLFRLFGVLWNLVKAIPVLPGVKKTMGDSQWVHMIKL